MMMNGYTERVGTPGADSIWANNFDIVYAGPGNDHLFISPYQHAYLIGGSGNDHYMISGGSYSLILDSSGNDTIVAPFRIDPRSTVAFTIDGGRHLMLIDQYTETAILVEDIRNHPIENFNFVNTTLSLRGTESAIRTNGNHGGDVSFKQLEQFGFGSESFWALGLQAEMDYILSREGELFGPTGASNPPPAPQPDPPAPPAPDLSYMALMDTHWYLSQNPDVAAAGVDPITHFTLFGWKEGRDPNPLFDTDWYQANYQDIAAAGINPFEHYMLHGWREGRDPNSLFDSDWYLAQNPDVAAADFNPLTHYMHYGWKEGRDPSAGFDTTHYLETHPDVALAGMNPLDHYLHWGVFEGREIAASGA